MTKQEYAELLKHPNWQKKRLEVLEAHKFACECCGTTEQTLHVHHGYYEKDAMPWDYPLESLHCLCEFCHDYIGVSQYELRRLIALLPVDELAMVKGYVSALLAVSYIPHSFAVGRDIDAVLIGFKDVFPPPYPSHYPNDFPRGIVRDGLITHNGQNYVIKITN